MANVSIGGNVTDSVLVYGNNNFVVKIGDVNGGVVNIIKPSDKPKYSARLTPVVIKPRTFRSLLDRENESEALKKAAQRSIPVSVWGKQGIGKTSFIRNLAHILDASNFTSGMIYLNVSGVGYEDLLQALFDSFFDSDLTYKPTLTEIKLALQSIKAIIFLDDLQMGRDEVTAVLDSAPDSVFILSSQERSLWGDGEVIPLRGLPENESIKLFEKELSRSLTDQEKTTVLKICSLLQGHPLQILQAASLVRDTGRSIDEISNNISSDKASDIGMLYADMANLSSSEKQVLMLLAAAGGNIVAQDHIQNIFRANDVQNDIARLIKLGLVQSHSPRFSIPSALATSISSTWDITSWQNSLLSYAINWLSQQPASALVAESSDLLVHILKNTGERQKWREVIQLGRALERFLVMNKRWQAWSDILNLILTAAKALKDSKTQAWALHQLGSRALYLGYTSQAKTFLSQALNIRSVIGDKPGLAITQHNINTLNGIVAPVKGNESGCRKYFTYGLGAVVAITFLGIVALIIFVLLRPALNNVPPTEPPTVIIFPSETPFPIPTFTITNTPTNTLTSTPFPTKRPTQTLVPSFTPTPTQVVFDLHPDSLDYVDPFGVPMRLVQTNGEFLMGSVGTSDGPDARMPAHYVELDTFYIDKYEVTNHLYKACFDAGVCTLPVNYDSMLKNDNNNPVVYVTWFQAQSYCEWRGAQLPTEAQWEKSARGGDKRLYPWGNSIDCSLANYNSCSSTLSTIGSYSTASASPYGLFDMAGNAWEWVADWYSDSYYKNELMKNPLGPDSGERRVLRGGSYVDSEIFQQVTFRNNESPDRTNWNIGFRCARSSP